MGFLSVEYKTVLLMSYSFSYSTHNTNTHTTQTHIIPHAQHTLHTVYIDTTHIPTHTHNPPHTGYFGILSLLNIKALTSLGLMS